MGWPLQVVGPGETLKLHGTNSLGDYWGGLALKSPPAMVKTALDMNPAPSPSHLLTETKA